MAKYITVKPHLTIEELEHRYRNAPDGTARSHWQILWLIARGKRTREVSDITSFSGQWIREIVRRYNANGPTAVGDQRQHNPGKPRLLTEEQEAQLRAEVEADMANNQPWTGPEVAARMSEIVGQDIYNVRGWEMLKRWGMKIKTPRPRHVKADHKQQEHFKKK